jgi:predicted hydrocarbon binding protein
MNRILLEEILRKMKINLKNGEKIGDFKVGALFALGSQLEAIFYYVGHELGSKFEIEQSKDIDSIITHIEKIAEEYHLGKIMIEEKSEDHITFNLQGCRSCRDFPGTFKSETGFCSFEAGLFAGIVEKITAKHCFSQELSCRLQGNESCQFMIVIPND